MIPKHLGSAKLPIGTFLVLHREHLCPAYFAGPYLRLLAMDNIRRPPMESVRTVGSRTGTPTTLLLIQRVALH